MSATLVFDVDKGDLGAYLLGTWKRTLESREFGRSYEHQRTESSVIVIEQAPDAAAEPGTYFLHWKFGPSLEDLKLAFSMHFLPSDGMTNLEWLFEGRKCHGWFQPRISVATLNFVLPERSLTETYRVVDRDRMAVSIVEVGSQGAVIQYGHMLRLRLS